jgi:peptidoglycan/xylan/chitin deacetylase (PgdA/CDA1 family)
MYHRVTDLEIDPWDLAVSPENFEEQLKVLKKRHNVFSLDELMKAKKNGKLEEGSIAITFDDGYKDNYTTAYPILVKHELPATFFISSAYIENQEEFWWDKLVRLIFTESNLPKRLELKAINRYWDIQQDNFDEKARFDFFFDVWWWLLQAHPILREEGLSEIESWSNHDKEVKIDHLPMSKAELIEMAQHPLISIEAHTNNHAALGYLDQDSQREEIQMGKLWLEKTLNKPVTGFSYPNGSYNKNTISLMEENGFEYACTTEEHRNSVYISNYKLPRFQVCNWNKGEFINKLEQW